MDSVEGSDTEPIENENQTLLGRLANIWEDFVSSIFGNSDGESATNQSNENGAVEEAASRKSRFSGQTSLRSFRLVGEDSGNTNSMQHTPSDGLSTKKQVVESDDVASSGCMNLLTATQVVLAQKKFVKLVNRPMAGASFGKKTKESKDRAPCLWEEVDSSTFLVRSIDYMRTRIKEPSAPSVYR